jgi:hydrogenase maturation protease
MQTPPRILVLGIGNTLLADEGVGVRALARVREGSLDPDLVIVDGGTLGLALLGCVEGADGLIVIDAARLELEPGSVRCYYDAGIDALLCSRLRTVHELGLKDLLDMARLSGTLPARRALITVEPACIDWETALSPVVEAALGEVSALVNETAAQWKTAWATPA